MYLYTNFKSFCQWYYTHNFFKNLFLIGGQLVNNVVLISAIHVACATLNFGCNAFTSFIFCSSQMPLPNASPSSTSARSQITMFSRLTSSALLSQGQPGSPSLFYIFSCPSLHWSTLHWASSLAFISGWILPAEFGTLPLVVLTSSPPSFPTECDYLYE